MTPSCSTDDISLSHVRLGTDAMEVSAIVRSITWFHDLHEISHTLLKYCVQFASLVYRPRVPKKWTIDYQGHCQAGIPMGSECGAFSSGLLGDPG